MSNFTKLALAGMMAATMGVGLARADAPAPAQKTAPIAGPLTDDGLLTLLQNMGYQPKVEKLQKTSIYTITITQGTWTYYVDVSLSDDKDQLWISCPVANCPKDGKVPAEKLQTL